MTLGSQAQAAVGKLDTRTFPISTPRKESYCLISICHSSEEPFSHIQLRLSFCSTLYTSTSPKGTRGRFLLKGRHKH